MLALEGDKDGPLPAWPTWPGRDRLSGLHRFFQGATWLWAGIFLLLTAGLAVLMVTEPLQAFMVGSTVATVALTVIAVSVVWFRAVLRRSGLRVRFAAS